MFGLGVVKGLKITLQHFIDTFVDDWKYSLNSALNEQALASRQGPEGKGLFTVEYPEMKLQPPENFRFIPFLVSDYDVPKNSPNFDRTKQREMNRCTSCGICSKVCPPQCIWIVRSDDPKTGKPIPQPSDFFIDTDVCMNCGYCAEFCPFDAIKMDHDYELADYEREYGHIHDLNRLLKPVSYYASIRPTWNAKEEATRQAAEEEKKRKEEEKKRQAAEKAAAATKKATEEAEAVKPKEPVAPAAGAETSNGGSSSDSEKKVEAKPPVAEVKPKKSPEEIKAQREAMMAKKRERGAGPDGQNSN